MSCLVIAKEFGDTADMLLEDTLPSSLLSLLRMADKQVFHKTRQVSLAESNTAKEIINKVLQWVTVLLKQDSDKSSQIG